MGNPDNNAATAKSQVSFEQKVNDAVKTLALNEETSVWEFPADTKDTLPEEVKVAAMAVKRHRDTQGMLTKSQQSLKAKEAQIGVLTEEFQKVATKDLGLSQDEQDALDDLMVTDPQAWRNSLNTFEERAKERFADTLSKTTDAANKASEKDQRRLALDSYNQEHNTEITVEILENDLPARFAKKLNAGEITFDEYLAEGVKYLTTGKVVEDKKIPKQPNLGDVGGGSTPSKQAVNGDVVKDYKALVF